jgi:hypothetical protein
MNGPLKDGHLLGLIHDRPQTKWTGQDDVRVVELRKVLDRLAGELQSQTEHVIVVTAEQLTEILGLVLPSRILRRGECVKKALLVLMLLGLVDPSDRIDHPHTSLTSWQNVQHFRAGEALVTTLDIGIGVLGQTCVVLEHLVPRLDDMVHSMKSHDVAHRLGRGSCPRAEEDILVVEYVGCDLLGRASDAGLDLGHPGLEFVFELNQELA